jgi:hypothetical protein
MASTPPGPFERCTPESADHRWARSGPNRREGTGRVSGRSPALDQMTHRPNGHRSPSDGR